MFCSAQVLQCVWFDVCVAKADPASQHFSIITLRLKHLSQEENELIQCVIIQAVLYNHQLCYSFSWIGLLLLALSNQHGGLYYLLPTGSLHPKTRADIFIRLTMNCAHVFMCPLWKLKVSEAPILTLPGSYLTGRSAIELKRPFYCCFYN